MVFVAAIFTLKGVSLKRRIRVENANGLRKVHAFKNKKNKTSVVCYYVEQTAEERSPFNFKLQNRVALIETEREKDRGRWK